ncbi:MAG: hypothetical protein LBH92_03515 [Bacteroidales bacterium]|jgi:hypothetical protein|nr:hypothetical protein [Bacteroidales bacterium]
MNNELKERLEWLIKHLRYTQALCEIILENLPDKDKKELIDKAPKELKRFNNPFM